MDVDVVVIGAGVMGLSVAWRLAMTGRDVVVYDQYCVGHAYGSSHGPTRVFRVLYDDPMYVRMAQKSIPLWRELEAVSGSSLLRMTGGLQVDDTSVLDRHRRTLEQCGAAVVRLTADERRARFPWLDAGDSSALWVEEMGVISADATVSSLHDAARDAGAVVIEDTPVAAIETGERVAVVTAGETVHADTCVVAAGAWARLLLATAGIDLPVRVTREQVLYFGADTAAMVPFVHGVPHWLYGVPGAGVLKVAEHGKGASTTADERTFDLDEPGAQRVRDYVSRVLPSIVPEPVSFETCLYTTTSDEDFVIDRRGPVIVCSPCSGHGFKFAPLIGEIVSALTRGEKEPPVPVARFALPRE
jgi:monomeric sarcosine oxidase